MPTFENVTVVMNPTAGADTAGTYRQEVLNGLSTHFTESKIDFLFTTNSEDPTSIGRHSSSDLILCLSGDGTVHGVAQGLMQRPRAERPALCVLPLGSGNDIARTFRIPSSPTQALPILAQGKLVNMDVARCLTDDGRALYCLETLSFGIDAAVALKTIELRKRTKSREATLYARAAVGAILHDLHANRYRYTIDGQEHQDDLLIMAIQNGPTYGGGFKVAPRALIDDGLLDICTSTQVSKPTALFYLSQMKAGAHEKLKSFQAYQAANITLDLDQIIPAQIDGEPISSLRYEIGVVPNAIEFLAPV